MENQNNYLRVKNIELEAGKAIVVLNQKDADERAIHVGDRVLVGKPGDKNLETAIIDTTKKIVKHGQIGLFLNFPLKAKDGEPVVLVPGTKPDSITYIRRKIDGLELRPAEIEVIIKDIVEDRLSEIELASFVTASYIHGYSRSETVALTWAMVNTGDKLDFPGITVDKHCVGGVPGNRTTMILVPILASLGLTVPKTSSRAITSPAGTADTMEVLCPVTFDANGVKRLVEKVGACIVWGGGMNLAPADDKIIKVEYPLSIDAEGQVLASIMSKKKSMGSDYVLVDIPCGPGAKLEDRSKAKELGEKFVELGAEIDMKVKYILTDGSNPIGKGIGPVLEAIDALKILYGAGPQDLAEKSIMMAGTLLEFCGKVKPGDGKQTARKTLESGAALKKMKEIIAAQGGNPNIKPEDLKPGKYSQAFTAEESGIIKDIDNKVVASIARTAGAPKDPGAGVYLDKGVGEMVDKGEKMFTVYAENSTKLEYAIKIAKNTPPYMIM